MNRGLRDNPLVKRVEIQTWKQIVEWEDTFGSTWMFRGHSGDWGLKSALHRVCDRFGKEYSEARQIEYDLMRDFSRTYVGDDSDNVKKDSLYCLAKMQHYGAPTRLLDWTYSFFIALFFAMEGAKTKDKPCIWAFNYEWTSEKLKSLGLSKWVLKNVDELRGREGLFENEAFIEKNQMVFVEGALTLNSRLAEQQGVFLLSGVTSETIDTVLNYQLDKKDVLYILELNLDSQELSKVYNKLYRMRMTYKSLFSDSSWYGRDLIMKIPVLSIRSNRILRNGFTDFVESDT